MDEPADQDPTDRSDSGSLRELTEKFLLAGLGLLSATKEQAQEAFGAAGEGPQLRERASSTLGSVLDEAGFVRKDRYDELELKVAQLEHRLRLLESGQAGDKNASAGGERPSA
jgi:polyhydroxyalkanoate synthesis regulator phasin